MDKKEAARLLRRAAELAEESEREETCRAVEFAIACMEQDEAASQLARPGYRPGQKVFPRQDAVSRAEAVRAAAKHDRPEDIARELAALPSVYPVIR